MPTADRPDGLVQIVAAIVNDTHSPERESVTLLNTSNSEISITGWSIADKHKNKMRLDGSIKPGSIKIIAVSAPINLSNKGGIISLLDDRGIKVDGVSYTRSQASHPGWTIRF